MSSYVLEAAGLVKSFGPTRALDGVDLAVRPGESVAIMGASGSGKTTLLHCLAGIVAPDAGTVAYRYGTARTEVTALSERERSRLRREAFGFVFQQGLLIPELTASENVALALMLNGIPRPKAEEHARGWLAALGLAGLEDRRIGQLSGGQAQRVAIARAQVTGAPVVFADEPTGALDSATSADVMRALLDSTVGQGRTLVLVTHDPGVAARCARIVEVRDGRIVAERPGHPAAGRVGTTDASGVADTSGGTAAPGAADVSVGAAAREATDASGGAVASGGADASGVMAAPGAAGASAGAVARETTENPGRSGASKVAVASGGADASDGANAPGGANALRAAQPVDATGAAVRA